MSAVQPERLDKISQIRAISPISVPIPLALPKYINTMIIIELPPRAKRGRIVH